MILYSAGIKQLLQQKCMENNFQVCIWQHLEFSLFTFISTQIHIIYTHNLHDLFVRINNFLYAIYHRDVKLIQSSFIKVTHFTNIVGLLFEYPLARRMFSAESRCCWLTHLFFDIPTRRVAVVLLYLSEMCENMCTILLYDKFPFRTHLRELCL